MSSRISKDIRVNVKAGTRIPAVVVDTFGGRASARMLGNGALMRNLHVTGGPVIKGDNVYIDFTTATPHIVAISTVGAAVSLARGGSGGGGGGGAPTEGPGIDIIGTQVGLGGDSILLYHSALTPVVEFAATEAGLIAALAAAVTGDIVILPARTIVISGSTSPSYSVGDQLDTGTVAANSSAGATIPGLTPGNWYAVRNAGGPCEVIGLYDVYDFGVSNDGGSIWTGQIGLANPSGSYIYKLDAPSFSPLAEAIDGNYGRFYFQATTASIKFRFHGYMAATDGDLDWVLSEAIYTPGSGVTIPAGVELIGLGVNSILDGNVVNEGICTNVKITGEISGAGISRMIEIDGAEQFTNPLRITNISSSPFQVSSSQVNNNLNADLLDGYHADDLITNPLRWFNVKDYSAFGDGFTDDTVAIQATIDACEAAGGGVVYFPAGIYIIGGALQDGARGNAQILLPSIDTSGEQISITLLGESMPNFIPSLIGAITLPTGGSIIKGTLNAGVGGSLLGGWGPVGSYLDFTLLNLKIENLTFQMPVNPVLTAVNLGHVAAVEIDNVAIHTGNYQASTIVEPTTATSYGLKTPTLNNGAWTKIDSLLVVGFYNGILWEEHANGDQIVVFSCKNAVIASSVGHSAVIKRLLAQWCVNVLAFTAAQHITIQMLNIEHYNPGMYGSEWFDPGNDIDDASNLGIGVIVYHATLSGTGADDPLVVNGGTNLHIYKVDDGFGGSTIANFADPTLAPGDIIYREDPGTNYALLGSGASATASSVYLGNIADNAIDGDDVTVWASTNPVAGNWIDIDLGVSRTFKSFRWYQSSNVNNRTHTVLVETSPDDATWTGQGTYAISVDDFRYNLPAAVTARYIRFTCLAGGTVGGAIVYTIEVNVDFSGLTRLPIGSASDVLTVTSGLPAWEPSAGGVLADHDHSGDAGDGGQFDAANLTSGVSADGQVLTSDGIGGAAWENPGAASGKYRQFLYALDGAGDFIFLTDTDGNPLFALMDLE